MRLTILLLWFTVGGYACSCSGYPSVGEAWGNAEAVVVGEVTRADAADSTFLTQTVRVRVTESFKGPAKGVEMILLQRGAGCAPRFKAGTRSLLYAHRHGDLWQVYGCGRGPDFAAEDLLFLRNLPRSAAQTRLSGTISLYEDSPTEGFRPVRPLAAFTVRISGATGKRSAVTNSEGVYEVYGLSPGQYTVTPELPPGLKVRFAIVTGKRASSSAATPSVMLTERANASVGFAVQEDNRIAGRVLDPAGKAMRDVCVDLETVEGQRYAPAFNCTNEEGAYLLENLPRGSYRIVLNRGGQPTGAMPFSATYYPGVSERAQATVINTGPDLPRTGFDFRLGKVEKRSVFTGQVQFRDGAAIAGATVELFRDGRRIERTRSGATGGFEIASLDGGRGELRATIVAGPETLKQCPHWQSYASAGIMNTQTLQIALDTPQSGLFLTISVSSCPGHLPGR